jgi:transposase
MPSGRPVASVVLQDEEREFLRRLARRHHAPQSEVSRAKAVLGFAEGLSNKEVAARVGICSVTAGTWRKRFLKERLEGLSDLPRSGAPRSVSDEEVARIVRLTLEKTPQGATHWSTRSMARRCGLSHDTVARIWKTFGLQPHRTESFRLSNDPYFVEKVRDVVGLYVSPPQNALVLCVDEKSQIQALERSQPLLPMRPGTPERRSSDYWRHGTLSLFAALDVHSGKVLAECHQRHSRKEFLSFLKHVESQTPKDREIHMVLDNYATHKTAQVVRWLARHGRWHTHFIPTHSSWLNQVERFFAKITHQRIRRGNFLSVSDLRLAIEDYIRVHNQAPKPFAWTASADLILGKVAHLSKGLV